MTGGIGAKGQKRFLIGQQVSASINSGSVPILLNSYNWSADNGSPFSTYNVVWKDASSPTSATFVPLGAQTQPTTTFYFKQVPAGSDNTKGVLANVSTPVKLFVPPGALPAGGLTTTLTCPCTIDFPTKTLDVHCGTLQPLPNATNPQALGLAGVTTPADITTPTPIPCGIYWRGKVTTPMVGATDGYPTGAGWNVTQLVKVALLRTEKGVAQDAPANDLKDLALDGTFGYGPTYPSLYPADGQYPWGSQDIASVAPIDADTTAISLNDGFFDYMMYLPPGNGSCFVPLSKFKWFCTGQAQLVKGSPSVWQYNIPTPSAGWSSEGEYPDHPQWTTNVANVPTVGQGLQWRTKPTPPQ